MKYNKIHYFKWNGNKSNKSYKFFQISVIFIIIINYLYNKKISRLISNFIFLKECERVEEYFKYCNDDKITSIKKYKKQKNKKISIISPIFNRGKYLLRFIKSIQNQNFKDIELILIDDCSSEDDISLIQKYQKDDQRIILIKNKKNRGTLASRNIGSLVSKGEYIILPDPDDILAPDFLYFFYNLAKKYDYEMIRFYIYRGNGKIYFDYHVMTLKSEVIHQPNLSTYLFYAQNKLMQIDYNVANKFIKREALIRALNFIPNYIYIYMNNFEDGLLNYILYRTVKSFYLRKKIGYYYIKNDDSITRKSFNIKNIKWIFYHLKIVFDYTKNNSFEKDMFNILFRRIVIWRNIKERILLIKNDFDFYSNLIDTFLDSEFVNIKTKRYLKDIKANLIKVQKNIKNR